MGTSKSSSHSLHTLTLVVFSLALACGRSSVTPKSEINHVSAAGEDLDQLLDEASNDEAAVQQDQSELNSDADAGDKLLNSLQDIAFDDPQQECGGEYGTPSPLLADDPPGPNDRIRQALQDMQAEANRIANDFPTPMTQGITLARGDVTRQTAARDLVLRAINIAEQGGLITAQQATGFRNRLNGASTDLQAASTALGRAEANTTSARQNAQRLSTAIADATRLLNTCPNDRPAIRAALRRCLDLYDAARSDARAAVTEARTGIDKIASADRTIRGVIDDVRAATRR